MPMMEAAHIEVEAGVRYWEDATVNGITDDDGSLVPGGGGDLWRARINLATGKIEDWPSDTIASIHYKVCDEGDYWLTDAAGQRIAKWRGHYVPDAFLCHGDEGFGDYIILNVGAEGVIEQYRRPEIDPERWASVELPKEAADGVSY